MKFVSFQLKDSVKQAKAASDSSLSSPSSIDCIGQAPNIHWGIVEGEQVRQFSHLKQVEDNLLSFISAGEQQIEQLKELLHKQEGTLHDAAEIIIKAPYLPKKNIICVGKNYEEHVIEMNNAQELSDSLEKSIASEKNNQDASPIPEYPVLFTKPYTSIVEHQGAIQSYPELTQELDYEGELLIIIGKKGTNIPKEAAFDYIFGYSILNDVTARDLQRRHKQFFKGKSLDTFAPFGPYIVHHTAIAQPQRLAIKTYVNNQLRQNGSTKDMIFDIASLIEVISSGMTLEPGDMIATGTPSGVGKGFNPPRFMKAGDQISVEIEQVGCLINIVR